MKPTRIIDNEQLALANEDIALAKAIWALQEQFPRRASVLHSVGHSFQAMATPHWCAAYGRPIPHAPQSEVLS